MPAYDPIKRNAKKLAQLNPVVRRKAEAVIQDLSSKGWHPLIAEAWRSGKQQAKKVADGVSRVKWSMHMASTPDGKPDSLAFDIVDSRYLWAMPEDLLQKFIENLVSSCKAHKLTNGSIWKSYGKHGDWAHCEIAGIPYRDAEKGTRPA